jgi:hypothetical protein
MKKKLQGRTLQAVQMALLIVICAAGLFGCKKISYDLTKNSELEDAPEYTVEFQENRSPAEGEVRKAF